MPRTVLAANVFQATVQRLESLYAEGHRVVHSFSGGKDSAVTMECAVVAARRTNRLPVELVMRDEELGWPDHYEYCERVANRPEIDFTWIIAREPHWYAYDRRTPFWWTFDPHVPPDGWVRRFPDWAEEIPEVNIAAINSVERFPPAQGKDLYNTIAIRAGESRHRYLGVFSQGGWLSGRNKNGSVGAWPIYDWTGKDVWTAINEFRWDIPSAYKVLYAAGVRGTNLRMGAFLNPYAASSLPPAAKAWPLFFDRLESRFPGLRAALRNKDRLLYPRKRTDETWRECFERENIQNAPQWISERSQQVAAMVVGRHDRNPSGQHDPWPFDELQPCRPCGPSRGCWRDLAYSMFLGDPFGESAASGIPLVQPADFRPELVGTVAGKWGTTGKEHPG